MLQSSIIMIGQFVWWCIFRSTYLQIFWHFCKINLINDIFKNIILIKYMFSKFCEIVQSSEYFDEVYIVLSHDL